jgi:hypothetical protein
MADRIAFDRSLYLPEAVEAAAEAYAEHARIAVTATADAAVAEIDAAAPEDQQTVMHAFCNHVLHETITRRRQAALEEDA